MLNICIPMAGRGSRFVAKGYETPKPFIPLKDGRPMILHVVENLTPLDPYRLIFLARREHEDYIRAHMSFATNVIYVDEVTEGAACTVLLAEKFINNSSPLVIANSDQLVTWNTRDVVGNEDGYTWRESNNIQDMINDMLYWKADAIMATFHATHPKWSYAQLDDNDEVVEVAEKKVISNHATVGIYCYKRAADFVKYAKQMIQKDVRVNNEFYICPVFNEMIEDRKLIKTYDVAEMFGMGTPRDLEETNEKIRFKNI